MLPVFVATLPCLLIVAISSVPTPAKPDQNQEVPGKEDWDWASSLGPTSDNLENVTSPSLSDLQIADAAAHAGFDSDPATDTAVMSTAGSGVVRLANGNFDGTRMASHQQPGFTPQSGWSPSYTKDTTFQGRPTRTAMAPPIAQRMQPNASDQITFNFVDAPWSVVLKKVAEEAGLALEMETEPGGSFSYYDPHPHSLVEALDVLNGFLIRAGFLLVRNQQLLMLISTENPEEIPVHLIELIPAEELDFRGRYELVSVEIPVFDAAPQVLAKDVQELLTPLGKIIPVNSANRLVVSDLRGRLDLILNLIRTGDSETGKLRREVVKLQNIKAEEAVQSLQQVLGQSRQVARSSTAARQPGGNSTTPTSVNVPIVALPETNSVIIHGTPTQLQRMRTLLLDLDRNPAQVHIQVLLVEVELSDKDEFGVELGIQDSVLFDRSLVENVLTTTETTTSPNGVQTTTEKIISSETRPGFEFNNQPLGNNTAISPEVLAGQALSTLGIGRINTDVGYGGMVLSAGSDSISVLLRALAATRKVDILSRPTIRTVDNRTASIQNGAQVPVVDGVNISANGNAAPVVRQDKSGIILEVTPKIADSGQIFMDIHAEKSEFRTGPGSGTPIYVDATSGNVIESPIKDVAEALATVSVMSGQTVVLGGMITKGVIDVRRKVPVLGDLPILGHLFRYDLHSQQRKELLIFLTPEVIADEQDSQAITQRELENSAVDVGQLLEEHCYTEQDMLMLPKSTRPSAPGFHPFRNWYVPSWRKLGDDSMVTGVPGLDRSQQIGHFLTPSQVPATEQQLVPQGTETLPPIEPVSPESQIMVLPEPPIQSPHTTRGNQFRRGRF